MKPKKDRELPLIEHLGELRRRLIISVLALVVGVGLGFAFTNRIFHILLRPAGPDIKPVFTEMTEMVGAYMKVSLLAGFIFAFPVILFQIVSFVAPGLSGRERLYLYILLPLSLLSFAGGSAFGYFVLFPPSFHFLLTFGSDIAEPYIRIGSYIDLEVRLMFWLGVVFEMPLVAFFLAKIRVLKPSVLSGHRRLAVVVAFVLGAIITPTLDPVNQTLVAMPIIVLYELSVWMARFAYGKPKAKGTESASATPSGA